MKKACRSLVLLLFIFAIGCKNEDREGNGNEGSTNPPPVPALAFNVTRTLPHDTSYFIEGLEFYNNFLIESTGNYGRSKLVKSLFPSGEIVQELKLGDQFFG